MNCEICGEPSGKLLTCSPEHKAERRRRVDKARYEANGEAVRARNRAAYARNPTKTLARTKRYREKNHRAAYKHQLSYRYGPEMTMERYDDMLIAQSGRCAICSSAMTQPCVDHDHLTLKVRGLLCSSCNNGLGRFKDNLESLQAAVFYIEQHRDARMPA